MHPVCSHPYPGCHCMHAGAMLSTNTTLVYLDLSHNFSPELGRGAEWASSLALALRTAACRNAPSWWRHRHSSRCPGLMGRALPAPGCAMHPGRAAQPPRAQWEAAVWF